MKKLIFVLMFISSAAIATDHLTETRYTDHVERWSDGRLKRNATVIKEFERLYPLPAWYNRNDWQIDHVIPLANCGRDAVSNLQWLPKTIKTCAGLDCKDRWERGGIYPKRC